MSELKEHIFSDIDEVFPRGYCGPLPSQEARPYYLKSEADKVIAELKAREDVLVTDNRDLLDKVKKLEERLHENAEHFKRNEAQILENADNMIAEKDKAIAELQKQVHDYAQGLYVIQARAEKEARHHKYKWCLAMANKCVDLCYKAKDLYRWAEDENLEHYYNRKIEFFARWHNSWLKLAEKFKEAK